MKPLKDLEKIRNTTLDKIRLRKDNDGIRVVIGMATCGIAAGARPVMSTFLEEVDKRNLDNIIIEQTGCIGVCRLEPIAEVYQNGKEKITYVNLTPEKVEKIVSEHLLNGNICTEYTIGAVKEIEKEGHTEERYKDADIVKSVENVDFFKKQTRIVLRNCGVINPEDIDEYLAFDGYKALEKVLTGMKPEEVISVIKDSGLRGRGGAGFPTGLKLELTKKSENEQKYVVCNADEGDPGAFMDRSVLEGDPHTLLEAMTIAGYSIGANQGYIYVRAEYPIAVNRLKIAIEQAREYGLLGKNIFGTNFSFDIDIRLGAGAFVCGEETALLTSIEGNRGEPNLKPPYPSTEGLWGKPTLINNVETYANIPVIILKGAEWFSSIGTEKSKGTKVFALGGKINNTGLVEVPMGITLREVIYDIGGGIPNGKKLKAVQTGGPSGGCIPYEHIDIPIDYDSLLSIGSMMGSGGMIVIDEDNCAVDIAKFFLEFTVDESCGKCTPCRVGTKRMYEILEKITKGQGTMEDIDNLETLAKNIKLTALCGLGNSAPNPVLSTLNFFRDEYEAHVKDKRCPARACKSLASYKIKEELCKSCGICKKQCPVDAISGEKGEPYIIDQEKCIKCGACEAKCPFKAIVK